VVYNAGSGSWGTLDEATLEQFERAWRVNALGLFATAKRLAPGMAERGRGNFVVVGATASLRGKPVTTTFAPAKAAQRSLAQALARQLGPRGIHVSLLIIDGRIGEAGTREPETQLDPNDIAAAAGFLAAQPASAWTFELDLRPRNETW
jgi:NAD(P)-dependent dehydrogenase (short-subunit alcohol dehydrogenase family)